MSPLQKTHLTVGILILSSLFAYYLSQSWYLLIIPALMGIGLVRAEITNNCPMTNLWAKLDASDKKSV
jgi:hypothetical protein